MNEATLEKAVTLARIIENFCPAYGYHVGITGGCLYKDGPRKDIDLVFYPHGKNNDLEGLLNQLAKVGLGLEKNHNNKYDGSKLIMSGVFLGIKTDCFFPL